MQTFYMGCDVSKGYADFVILDEKMNCIEENFQLDDTASGHAELSRRLSMFFEKHPSATLCSAVESTGGYERNWHSFLLKKQHEFNLKAARINPLGVCHDNKASMTRNLTDKISARNIAEYLIRHSGKVRYGQDDPNASLKKLWCHIKMLKKQYNEHHNELEALLYSANPEILSYCRNGLPNWVLKLLSKYPTPAILGRAKVKTVASIPFIPEKRATELIKQARASVAASEDPMDEFLIRSTTNQLIHLDESVKLYEERLKAECNWPEVDLIMTIGGIGRMTAIVMMLYIEDIRRFSSAKKLASFLGVHPEYKLSGDGVKAGSFKMSKKGQKAPRAQLYMCVLSALSLKNRNQVIRRVFDEKKAQGMSSKAAIGVCIHKYVRIVYGVLSTGTRFDPAIDEKNRTKEILPKKATGVGKNRRFQGYDENAPISRRQKKKRMEQTVSQDSQTVECGICGRAPMLQK